MTMSWKVLRSLAEVRKSGAERATRDFNQFPNGEHRTNIFPRWCS